MNRRILFATSGMALLLVVTGALLLRNSVRVQSEFEWSPFTMIYTMVGEDSLGTNRLVWFSKQNWTLEMVENVPPKSSPGSGALDYTGTRYEFKDGVYSTYAADGTRTSQQIMEDEVPMSPGQWLVPGYLEYLKRSGYEQSGTTGDGNTIYSHSENRMCPKGKNELPFVENCSPDQVLQIEYVFDSYGIPLSRTEKLDDKVLSNFQVQGLIFR